MIKLSFILIISILSSAAFSSVWQCKGKDKLDVIILNLDTNVIVLGGSSAPITKKWRLPNSSLGVSTLEDFHFVLENSIEGARAYTLDKAKKVASYQCQRSLIN